MTNATPGLEASNESIQQDLNTKLEELLGNLALDVSIATREIKNGVAYFDLTGGDTEIFLDHKAEPLKSIAFLLQAWLDHHQPNNGIQVMVDARGELRHRETELEQLVKDACGQLTKIGQEAKLEGLNPYDRRVVYLLLEGKTEFFAESLGSGHFKNMIIRRVG